MFNVLFSKPVIADSYYWTGNAGTTNWTTANNWFNITTNSVSNYPGSSGTSDVAQIWTSNVTINLTSTITISSLQTPFYGTYNLTVTFTGNPTLNVAGISTAQPVFTSSGLTFSGPGTVNVGSSVGFQYLSGFVIGANAIVNFPSGTAVTFNNPPAFSNAGTLNLNNATFTISNTINNSGTININGASASISTSAATNNSGTITCTSGQFSSSSDLTNSGTVNILSSGYFDLSGGPSIFTNTNTVNLSSSSTLRLSNNGGRLINSGSAVFTANASTVNLYGSGAYINNSATLKATGTTFSFNNGNYIQNTGTLTTQSACVFNMTTSNSYISNTSTYTDHGSTYNLLGSGSYFQNSGSTSVVKARGTTFNLGTNGNNSMNITNSGTFTADSTSYINLASYQDGLTNTGVFNAGTSGSPCKITLSAQACFVTNTGSSSQSAYFNLGSTSIISISGGYQPTVTNTSNAYSFFTLMSDALGSAAFDQILSTTNGAAAIAGTYNVQRFVSGGNLATNRGYRIFSSPTNITNPYSTSTTYTNYISLNTLKNSYTVYSSITANSSYPGAFTAGPSGNSSGFSYANTNSTIYFYNETRAVSNTSFNSGKHVGVTAIGASTVTLNGVGAVSMPVGNGYILYYVGPNSRTDGVTGNPLDCYITNVGYVNQGDVTVALWYTPKNGSSNASTGQLSYSLTTLTGGAGYNMVGNPYPSTINIATVLGHNANISTAYLLNKTNSPGQAYYAYTANGASAPGIGYALSGEGFLVRTTSGGNSLTFKETDKVASQQLTGSNLLMSSPNGQALTIDGADKSFKSTAAAFAPQTAPVKELDTQGNPLTGLYVKIEKDSLTYDYCGVYFRSDWQSTYSENLDALELDASSSSVLVSSLSSDGMNAAVKHFPDYKKGVNIKLYANGKTDGLYNLKIEGIRNIDTNNYKITLLDHFKKDSSDIGRYKSYAFNILKSDTGTYGANRFELSVHQLPAGARYQLASFTAQKSTDGVLLTWRAYNEGDNYFYTLEKQQANGTDYTSLYQIQSNGGTIYKYTDKTPNTGNNIYRLKQVDLFGNITYSALVSIYYDNNRNASMFTLYPNPTAEIINVNVTYGKTSSATTGSYKLNIYDATGSLVTQKTADKSSFSQNVSEFKPGVYIVELKDNQGSSLGKTKFLKK